MLDASARAGRCCHAPSWLAPILAGTHHEDRAGTWKPPSAGVCCWGKANSDGEIYDAYFAGSTRQAGRQASIRNCRFARSCQRLLRKPREGACDSRSRPFQGLITEIVG